jgi:hypothetical protein
VPLMEITPEVAELAATLILRLPWRRRWDRRTQEKGI